MEDDDTPTLVLPLEVYDPSIHGAEPSVEAEALDDGIDAYDSEHGIVTLCELRVDRAAGARCGGGGGGVGGGGGD